MKIFQLSEALDLSEPGLIGPQVEKNAVALVVGGCRDQMLLPAHKLDRAEDFKSLSILVGRYNYCSNYLNNHVKYLGLLLTSGCPH